MPACQGIQYAAALRFHHSHLGILDRPPEPVIGRPFGRPVGGRCRLGGAVITSLRAKQSIARVVIASEAKQSILPLRGEMDCFAALAMTSKHTFATSRRDAPEPVGWVEPSAKPIIYANCDDGYPWRSTHPTSFDSIIHTSEYWIARRSLSSGGHSADPLAGDHGRDRMITSLRAKRSNPSGRVKKGWIASAEPVIGRAFARPVGSQ